MSIRAGRRAWSARGSTASRFQRNTPSVFIFVQKFCLDCAKQRTKRPYSVHFCTSGLQLRQHVALMFTAARRTRPSIWLPERRKLSILHNYRWIRRHRTHASFLSDIRTSGETGCNSHRMAQTEPMLPIKLIIGTFADRQKFCEDCAF